MNAHLKKLWDEAYKGSHVLADIAHKQVNGEEVDARWFADEARRLNCTAQEIVNALRGVKVEEPRP